MSLNNKQTHQWMLIFWICNLLILESSLIIPLKFESCIHQKPLTLLCFLLSFTFTPKYLKLSSYSTAFSSFLGPIHLSIFNSFYFFYLPFLYFGTFHSRFSSISFNFMQFITIKFTLIFIIIHFPIYPIQ